LEEQGEDQDEAQLAEVLKKPMRQDRYQMRPNTDHIVQEASRKLLRIWGGKKTKENTEKVWSWAWRANRRGRVDDDHPEAWFRNVSPVKVLPAALQQRAETAETQRKRVTMHTKRLLMSRIRQNRPSARPTGTVASMFAQGPSQAQIDRIR